MDIKTIVKIELVLFLFVGIFGLGALFFSIF